MRLLIIVLLLAGCDSDPRAPRTVLEEWLTVDGHEHPGLTYSRNGKIDHEIVCGTVWRKPSNEMIASRMCHPYGEAHPSLVGLSSIGWKHRDGSGFTKVCHAEFHSGSVQWRLDSHLEQCFVEDAFKTSHE